MKNLLLLLNLHSHSTERIVLRVFFAVSLISSILIFSACEDDSDNGGPAGLGKPFNIVVDGLNNSIVSVAYVSADGSKMFVRAVADDYYYRSSNGGETFTLVENAFATKTVAIDNQGNLLTYDNKIFIGSSGFQNVTAPGEIILGDNGKMFSYHLNTGKVFAKNVTDASFTEVPMPITPTPGSGGSTYHAVKAIGKGLLFIDASGAATRTIKTFLLDEASMTWSERAFTVERSAINNCNGLSQNERYKYVGNNTIALKGCSGFALLNVSTGAVTTLGFPPIEGMATMGEPFMDNQNNLYVYGGNYSTPPVYSVYKYSGSSWAVSNDIRLPSGTDNLPFAADASNNLYFNGQAPGPTTLSGFVKYNAQANSMTELGAPAYDVTITDATAVSESRVLLVAENKLIDFTSGGLEVVDIGEVSHVNILSDGRWVAGGRDRIQISDDEGETWTETKNIFSSIDTDGVSLKVFRTRLVDGKVLVSGLFHWQYYNQALGVYQDKYENMFVEFDGNSSSDSDTNIPNDLLPTCIGPDGTVYGKGQFVSDFGSTTDHYEIKPGETPELLTSIGFSPMIITDDNLQMAIGVAADQSGFEVIVRNNTTDEWRSANTPLPGGLTGSYEALKIIQSGNRMVFVKSGEVYVN